MNKISGMLLSSGIMLCLSACCTKKECYSPSLNTIELYNFPEEMLQDISVEKFENTANGLNKLDSTHYSLHYSDTLERKSSISLYKAAAPGNSYRITFHNAADPLVYEIAAISTAKRGCNQCFPYRPEHDKFPELSSYTLNGEKVHSKVFTIKK